MTKLDKHAAMLAALWVAASACGGSNGHMDAAGRHEPHVGSQANATGDAAMPHSLHTTPGASAAADAGGQMAAGDAAAPTAMQMGGSPTPRPSGSQASATPATTASTPTATDATPADPAFTQGPFTGSAACATCHDGIIDAAGRDVSIVQAWSSTMMANAARDPLWQAKLESELQRNPKHADVITDKCTRCHAPMAHELGRQAGELLAVDQGRIPETSPYHAAAQDGVSCTLCHQIQDKDLGAAASFDGNFTIGTERAIFGPYQDVFTMPMQRMVNYTPQYGAQIQRAELCGTCHNVKTPILDSQGELVAGDPEQGFAEQAPYTEWKQSAYAQSMTCADCHMGRTDGVILSVRPPWLDTARDRFALHGFAGANKLMLGVLDKHRAQLAVRASDFTAIQARTDMMLASAAKLELSAASVRDGTLEMALRVLSTTGHKLPTSFPSRRVVLHVQIVDARDQVVFESGRIDDAGRVVGQDGMPLDSERDLSSVEPHHDVIDSPSQAQIYESVMQDSQGKVTFTLLNGAAYIKDNRLLPRLADGTDKAGLPADIAVRGDADRDQDFQSGEDTVHFRIKGLTAGPYRVRAALMYQTLSARFAADLFSSRGPASRWFEQAFAGAEHKTIELTRLEASVGP